MSIHNKPVPLFLFGNMPPPPGAGINGFPQNESSKFNTLLLSTYSFARCCLKQCTGFEVEFLAALLRSHI